MAGVRGGSRQVPKALWLAFLAELMRASDSVRDAVLKERERGPVENDQEKIPTIYLCFPQAAVHIYILASTYATYTHHTTHREFTRAVRTGNNG